MTQLIPLHTHSYSRARTIQNSPRLSQSMHHYYTLPPRTRAICHVGDRAVQEKQQKGSDGVTLSHVKAEFQPRRGENRGRRRGRGWENRPRGGERAAGHSRELSEAPAQPREPALWLSGHGAAVPGAEVSAGATAAAATDTATGAAGGAVPRALQLPSGRRPALPWPAGRPHPTVSTPCLRPGILTRSGSPFLPTLAPFTWKLGKRSFALSNPTTF